MVTSSLATLLDMCPPISDLGTAARGTVQGSVTSIPVRHPAMPSHCRQSELRSLLGSTGPRSQAPVSFLPYWSIRHPPPSSSHPGLLTIAGTCHTSANSYTEGPVPRTFSPDVRRAHSFLLGRSLLTCMSSMKTNTAKPSSRIHVRGIPKTGL